MSAADSCETAAHGECGQPCRCGHADDVCPFRGPDGYPICEPREAAGSVRHGQGSARNHSGARRKLRKKLEAQGYPPEEVARLVEEKRAAQNRRAVAQAPQKGERPSWWSKNYPRRLHLAMRDGEVCHWCGAALNIKIKSHKEASPPRATLDHVIPRSAGGSNDLGNLVLSCAPCNEARGGVHSEGAFDGLAGLPSAKGRRTERERVEASVTLSGGDAQ